jgi:hypothetical protein
VPTLHVIPGRFARDSRKDLYRGCRCRECPFLTVPILTLGAGQLGVKLGWCPSCIASHRSPQQYSLPRWMSPDAFQYDHAGGV